MLERLSYWALALVVLGGCFKSPTERLELDANVGGDGDGDGDGDGGNHMDGGLDAQTDTGVDLPPPDCTTNVDCKDRPDVSWCDPSLGTCAECRSPADCRLIQGATACVEGVGCVECNDPSACDDQLCHPQRYRCVDCVDDDHCTARGEGYWCDQTSFRCVQCAADKPCTSPAASVCNDEGACVPCTPGSDQCMHLAETPFCGDEGECVACTDNEDCTAEASVCQDGRCVQCQADAEPDDDGADEDCEHLDETPACFEGTCVECTRDKREACDDTASGKAVCNALTHTCMDDPAVAPGSANDCDECVSDVQCEADHVCAAVTFDGQPIPDKHFCLPAAQDCENHRPYFKPVTNAVTIDGATADLCALRVSTCAAHDHYSNTNCGVMVGGVLQGDDSLCGLPDLDDGYCVRFTATAFRCTVPCNGDPGDCPELAGQNACTPDNSCAL